ncbi:hypothetical protein [Streptomyces luteireticuli]|uniref:hypothetical protein n=1 Tax=Streptomyces luteireticuli TaxID=173858 RepID=UPI003555ED95
MPLSDDEHALLLRVSKAERPVAMSDFIHDIHPPDFPVEAAEDDHRREAWVHKQFGLYRAVVRLHELGLVRVVHPANGERPDLVEATQEGRTTLG